MDFVKRFWFFVGLQLGLTLAAIVVGALLSTLGVSRAASFAVAVGLTIPVVVVVVTRMKRREDQKVAAMPPAEATAYESRRLRIGLAGSLIGTAFFAVAAVTFRTPQAFLVLVLYAGLTVSLVRRARKRAS